MVPNLQTPKHLTRLLQASTDEQSGNKPQERITEELAALSMFTSAL